MLTKEKVLAYNGNKIKNEFQVKMAKTERLNNSLIIYMPNQLNQITRFFFALAVYCKQ